MWSKLFTTDEIRIQISITLTYLLTDRAGDVTFPAECSNPSAVPAVGAKSHGTERRTEAKGRRKESRSPPRHFVARSRSDKYTNNGIHRASYARTVIRVNRAAPLRTTVQLGVSRSTGLRTLRSLARISRRPIGVETARRGTTRRNSALRVLYTVP